MDVQISLTECARLVLCMALLFVPLSSQQHPAPPKIREGRYTISGRVVDRDAIIPKDAMLVLVMPTMPEMGGSSSSPVPVAKDGSFTTRRVDNGMYVLQIVRRGESPVEETRMFGLTAVRVTNHDVTGITVAARQEVTINGSFRMETDNPAAPWPTMVVVSSFLVIDGFGIMDEVRGAPASGGRFVLRDPFGPRVLRMGYTVSHGQRWWFSRVLLDGRDVSNVPTDFSQHPRGVLEIVFTKHPAVLEGRVTDADGKPAPGAWVVVFPEDPALWHWWASTFDAVRTDSRGEYSAAVRSGRYLLCALPRNTFASLSEARRDFSRLALGAVPAEVRDRETRAVPLTLRPLQPKMPVNTRVQHGGSTRGR